MKVVWTGAISFGLVNIPIRLYSAVEQHENSFRLLHKKDNVPLKYKRWCPKHNHEVPWNEVVKGLEIGKNKFFVMEKEELEKLRPKGTDEIEITEIIDSWQIDPVYFDHHYFIGPDSEKEKAYFLLKNALEQAAKAAVGKFVMKEREHVCAIESYKSGLLLTTLNYAHEIRDIRKVDFLDSAPELKQQEISLATQLIAKLEKKEFKIAEFRDTFEDELKLLIKKKAKKGFAEVEYEPKRAVKEKNLIEALKASL
jgi:DNA end-binding protein Ku